MFGHTVFTTTARKSRENIHQDPVQITGINNNILHQVVIHSSPEKENTTLEKKSSAVDIIPFSLIALSAVSDSICIAYALQISQGESLFGLVPIFTESHDFYTEMATILSFYFVSDLMIVLPWAKEGIEEMHAAFSEEKTPSTFKKMLSRALIPLNLYSAFSDGVETYFFFSTIAENYQRASIPFSIASSACTLLSESIYTFKTVRDETLWEILAGNPEQYSSTLSRYGSPVIGLTFGIPCAINDFVQSYIPMILVFPTVQSSYVNNLLFYASASNAYGDFIFTRHVHIHVIDKFFKKSQEIIEGKSPKTSEVVSFIISASFSTLLAEIQRQGILSILINADFLSDEMIQLIGWATAIRTGTISAYYMTHYLTHSIDKLIRYLHTEKPAEYKSITEEKPTIRTPLVKNNLFQPSRPPKRSSLCERLKENVGCVIL